MIRHGEKPDDGANNLSAEGEARAQRLRQVFGKESGYNIGYIVAEHPKKGLRYSFHLRFSFANRVFCGLCQANESI